MKFNAKKQARLVSKPPVTTQKPSDLFKGSTFRAPQATQRGFNQGQFRTQHKG